MKKHVKWLARQLVNDEFQRMRTENNELGAHVERLTKENIRLQSRVAELEHVRDILYRENQEQASELADVQRENQALEQRLAQLQAHNADLEQQAMMFAATSPSNGAKPKRTRKKVQTAESEALQCDF
jgi:chromosome segregation ATPase